MNKPEFIYPFLYKHYRLFPVFRYYKPNCSEQPFAYLLLHTREFLWGRVSKLLIPSAGQRSLPVVCKYSGEQLRSIVHTLPMAALVPQLRAEQLQQRLREDMCVSNLTKFWVDLPTDTPTRTILWELHSSLFKTNLSNLGGMQPRTTSNAAPPKFVNILKTLRDFFWDHFFFL